MTLVMRKNSLRFRALMFLWSPTYFLPPLFGLWAEPARVGQNYTDWVKVRLTLRDKV
jgi:hypothetical protein